MGRPRQSIARIRPRGAGKSIVVRGHGADTETRIADDDGTLARIHDEAITHFAGILDRRIGRAMDRGGGRPIERCVSRIVGRAENA